MGDERRTLNAQSCIARLRPSRVSRVSRVSLTWRFSSSAAVFTHSRDDSLASQENLEESFRAPDLMRIAPDPQGTERLHPLLGVMTDATRGNRENPVSQNTNSGAGSVFFTCAPRHGTLPDILLPFESVRVSRTWQRGCWVHVVGSNAIAIYPNRSGSVKESTRANQPSRELLAGPTHESVFTGGGSSPAPLHYSRRRLIDFVTLFGYKKSSPHAECGWRGAPGGAVFQKSSQLLGGQYPIPPDFGCKIGRALE